MIFHANDEKYWENWTSLINFFFSREKFSEYIPESVNSILTQDFKLLPNPNFAGANNIREAHNVSTALK